jgi:hypothetical protein
LPDRKATREKIKKLLAAVAGTCLGACGINATYTATGAPGMSARILHLVAMVGIAAGILGASPLGRIILRDDDPPAPGGTP